MEEKHLQEMYPFNDSCLRFMNKTMLDVIKAIPHLQRVKSLWFLFLIMSGNLSPY